MTRDYTLDDLTPSQQRTLAIMSRVNLNEGGNHDWVSQREGMHKGSLASLERLGIVEYDRYLGRAKTRPVHFWVVSLCRQAVEHGTCGSCHQPLGRPDARGWTGDAAYHFDCARAVYGDEFRTMRTLTTIECSKPGDVYRLLETGPRLIVHLAGTGKGGGTGQCICGYDRHTGGFSVGGGVKGSGVEHEVCAECARLARLYEAPVRGLHADLLDACSVSEVQA